MKSGKIWGLTELVHGNQVLEFHRVEIKSGGYCSKHKHQFKWNGFYVEDGCLQIKVWKKGVADFDEINHLHALSRMKKLYGAEVV